MSSSPLNYGILEALMLIEEEGLQSRGAKDAEVSQRKTTLGANLEETLPVILGYGFAALCLGGGKDQPPKSWIPNTLAAIRIAVRPVKTTRLAHPNQASNGFG